MSMFKKGFSVAREERERQAKAQEARGKRIFNFFLTKDGEEADVIFLTEEPVNYFEHTIKGVHNGKEVYNKYTCTQDNNCEFCNKGDNPSFKGAFLVYDTRPFTYKDKDGNEKEAEGSVKLLTYGTKSLSQLDRLSTKYGLAGRTITVVRTGKGTATTYTFERGDKEDLSEDDIRDLLPDKLKDDYDGTEDSLYKIIEEQLKLNVKGDISDDDNEDDEDETTNSSSGVINVDDEEDEPKKSDSGERKSPFKNKKKLSLKK